MYEKMVSSCNYCSKYLVDYFRLNFIRNLLGFFDIQRLDGQEVITVSDSPDSSYTVTAYLNNGGATTDYAVLCAVKNNKTGKERNIYWNYHCSTADIQWLDDKTVSINGIELDVTKDKYDYRRN